jgi:uncharacterized protein
MRFKLLYIFIFGLSFFGFTQNTKVVVFLKDLWYIKQLNGKTFACDSTTGTMIESKICANIELRQKDSVMLSNFNNFINYIKTNDLIEKSDSLVSVFKNQQILWEAKRKSVSMYKADGCRAHTEGIIYMQSMTFFTELRIREIEYMQALY